MNDIVKKQHYVPAFYLRKFTNKNNKLEILNCDEIRIETPRSPKKVCREEYFYSVNDKLDDISQIIEKEFSRIETGLGQVYENLIEKIIKNKKINHQDKDDISILMSMMFLRGKYMRKQIKRMDAKFYKETAKMRFGHNSIHSFFDDIEKKEGIKINKEQRDSSIDFILNGEYDIESNNASHLRILAEMDEYRNLFFAKYWTIYISKSEFNFATSDNPVTEVFPADWDKGFFNNHFFSRSHYFALSPKILIEAKGVRPDINKKTIKRKDVYDEEEIINLNFIQSNYANKYAYSCLRKDLQILIDKENGYREKINKAKEFNFNKSISNFNSINSS